MLSRCRLDFGVECPWLDDGNSGGDIYFDRAHSLQADDDASRHCGRSAGEAATSAARHHRHPMLGCPSDCALNLCCVTRANDCNRNSRGWIARPVEAVVLARDGIFSYGITQDRDELLECSLHAVQVIPACAAVVDA